MLLVFMEEFMQNLSVVKRQKQSEARRLRNKAVKSSIRTCEKNVTSLVHDGEFDKAQNVLKTLQSKLDSAARKGVVSKNFAARKKSRVNKFYTSALNQNK